MSFNAAHIEAVQADAGVVADASLRVRRMKLFDFRSYASADIAFDGRPVAISGRNGAGKTNLLEAISLLGPGRGLRRARLDEVPRVGGSGGWAVSAWLGGDGDNSGDDRQLGVGVMASRPDRRICKIDEQAVSGPGALLEEIRFIWLTPAQDRLFMEGASERRRFIDRMTLAHDPAHAKTSSEYDQAMRQRQRLLDDGVRDDRWLEALERRIAEAGVAIAAARCDMVSRLAAAECADVGAAFPAADVGIEGSIEAAIGEQKPSDIEDDYARRLAENRYRDAAAGRLLEGPHRSDLVVAHREKGQMARLCSTGEQKALLIGLILSSARALKRDVIGGAPLILLLDEVAAHLDPARRAALFSIIDAMGFQAFMTGTDRELFEAWGARAQFIDLRDDAASQ